MKNINRPLAWLAGFLVVVLLSACKNAADPADATSQDAEMTVAEVEALWLDLPGNDTEFNRLVVEELRTGIPMDWDDALRALEADGWRIPDRARRTSGQDPMGVASAGGRDVYCSIVHEPTDYYGGAQWYREAIHALSFCKGQQRVTCSSVRHESTRVAWKDDDGREHVSPHEYWVARGCSVEDSEQVS